MSYTMSLGKQNGLELGVTYNYYPILRRVMGEGSLHNLYGKTGRESIPMLQDAVKELRGEPAEDYFALTEGNVRAALLELLAMAKQRPKRKWYIW
jgi:hypothetical protein